MLYNICLVLYSLRERHQVHQATTIRANTSTSPRDQPDKLFLEKKKKSVQKVPVMSETAFPQFSLSKCIPSDMHLI